MIENSIGDAENEQFRAPNDSSMQVETLVKNVVESFDREIFTDEVAQRLGDRLLTHLNNIVRTAHFGVLSNDEEIDVDWERIKGMKEAVEALGDEDAAAAIDTARKLAWRQLVTTFTTTRG